MTKLFNKEDILTVLTTDKAKIGDKGYFGDNLRQLNYNVVHDEVHSLVWIDNENPSVYSFKNDLFEDCFALFLPADKVKNKKPTYRPLKNIDELFSFLMPDIGNQKINKYKKAELLLGKKITLRRKDDNFIKVMVITDIDFYDKDIFLNGNLLEYLFVNYEIKIDDEFVPFGILEE